MSRNESVRALALGAVLVVAGAAGAATPQPRVERGFTPVKPRRASPMGSAVGAGAGRFRLPAPGPTLALRPASPAPRGMTGVRPRWIVFRPQGRATHASKPRATTMAAGPALADVRNNVVRGDRQPGSGSPKPVASGRVGAGRTFAPRPAAAPQGGASPAVPPRMVRGGHTFTETTVVRGHETLVERRSERDQVRYYQQRHWGRRSYSCYVHYWPYDPWFWSFYFAPFPAPWPYTWFWIGSPWYVTWGWYYQPYPVYIGPSYWVTDYVLSTSLEEEYARGYAAGQQSAGTPITEPVKEELRKQVDETAKTYQAEQAVDLQQALKTPGYLFVVDTPLSVTKSDDTTCTLTGGDILKAAAEVGEGAAVAQMAVVTSKDEKCQAGSQVSVSLTDLQEMLNSFGQKVDDGMKELQKNRGPQDGSPP
jgi:hypothetical protein